MNFKTPSDQIRGLNTKRDYGILPIMIKHNNSSETAWTRGMVSSKALKISVHTKVVCLSRPGLGSHDFHYARAQNWDILICKKPQSSQKMADHSMWFQLTNGSNLQLLRCLKPGCGLANNWFPSTFQDTVAKVPGFICTTHMVKLLVENREVLPGQQFQVAVFITLQPARRLNFEWIFFNLRLFLRSCTIAFPLHKVINSLLDQNS
jgi:hypothetical protein